MAEFQTKSCFRNIILFGTALVLLCTANFLTVFGGFFYEIASDMMFAANIVLNLAILWDLASHIRRDFAMLVFFGTFNVLLLGRVYVSFLGHHSDLLFYLEAKDFESLFIALQVVTISILSVFAAYRFSSPLFFRREKRMREKGSAAYPRNAIVPVIRQISVLVLLVSSIPFFYLLAESILVVLKSGYQKSFTIMNDQSAPSIINRMSMFFTPSFAVFLATLPNRKQLKFPMLIYGVYMLASLFTGRRNTFVTEALMIVVYFVLRDTLLPKGRRVLKKRMVIWGIVAVSVLMYLLQLVAVIRSGGSLLGKNFMDVFVNAFFSQGASFRVVVQTVNQWDQFNHAESWKFLFYPFEMFVHNNLVFRSFFGLTPIIEVQNMQFVQSTHNFAHVLTYMVDPGRYLSGGGFGTSFVAESYVAFGFPGVMAVSMLFGVIFRFFASMLTRPWPILASCLIAIKGFVYVPRSFAFLWVTDVLNLTYLSFYIGIYLLALLIVWLRTHVRTSAGLYRRGPAIPEEET